MCLCITYGVFNVGKDLDNSVSQGLKGTFCSSYLFNNVYGALYIGKDISISWLKVN